jgi:hypothetical protein
MTRKASRDEYYYYASGRPVELKLDRDWVAADRKRLADAGVAAETLDALGKDARSLRGDLFLARRKSVPPKQLQELEQAGAVEPVFQAQGAMIVVLPEVRVEDPSQERRAAVQAWLRKNGQAEVVSAEDDRIVLRPTSGRALDALDIANQLAEQVGPALAQARFLRVTARPSTMR